MLFLKKISVMPRFLERKPKKKRPTIDDIIAPEFSRMLDIKDVQSRNPEMRTTDPDGTILCEGSTEWIARGGKWVLLDKDDNYE